uniref:Uncharacterized protein n=1 Tax=Ditylenchus dipsaci TaxID=166011 RepID=A0A915CS18_9BILA
MKDFAKNELDMKNIEYRSPHTPARHETRYTERGYFFIIATYLMCFRLNRFIVVKDERELEQQAMCLTEAEQYLSGVVLLNVTENTTHLHPLTAYKIRHSPALVDGTGSQMDNRRNVVSRDDPWIDLKYLTFGFSFLQEAVERAIIEMEPYPCVNIDSFNVTPFLALFLILSWMIPASLLVKNIVWEKEMRLKEIMRVMGLGDAIHCYRVHFPPLLCPLFPLPTVHQAESAIFSHLALFLPQTAVGYGMWMLATNDDIGNSTWENLHLIQLDVLGMTLRKVLIALAVDCLVYVGLAWYISAVFPGSYGIPQKWYFPATKRFWIGRPSDAHGAEASHLNGQLCPDQEFPDEHEPVGDGQLKEVAAVRVSQLTKVYGNDTKALDSLSVDFYESQITAFLGHNELARLQLSPF